MSEIKKINVGGKEYDLSGSGGGAEAYVEGSALYINNSGSGSNSGGSSSGGSSSGATSIVNIFEDVTELPESLDGQKIYKIITPKVYEYDGERVFDFEQLAKAQLGIDCRFILVDKLPDNPIKSDVSSKLIMYILDDQLYIYGISPNNVMEWFTFELLLQSYGFIYGGIVQSLDSINWREGYVYVYLGDSTYNNNNNTFQTTPHLVYTSEITLESANNHMSLGVSFDFLKNYKHIDIEISTIINMSDGSGSLRETNMYNPIKHYVADILDPNGNTLGTSVSMFFYVFDTDKIMKLQVTTVDVELWLNKITTTGSTSYGSFSAGTYTIKLYAK